jgi:hypothetical protein
MASEVAQSPVFIGGHARSGTTLLVSLLDAHPDLLVYPRETQFFRLSLPLFRQDPEEGKKYAIWAAGRQLGFAPHFYKTFDPLFYKDGDDPADFHARIARLFEELGKTEAALLAAVVLAYGEISNQQNKRFWVEKSVFNERFAKDIHRLYPNAKMIYIVHDPRAVLPSYRVHREMKSESYLQQIQYCANWAVSYDCSRSSVLPFPVFTLRYEDLIMKPRETAHQICDFLTIPFNDSLLHPTLAGGDYKGYSAYSLDETNFQRIDASPLTKWKSKISLQDRRVIKFLLSSYMKNLDYQDDDVTFSSQEALSMLPQYSLPYYLVKHFIRTPFSFRRKLVFWIAGKEANSKDWLMQYYQERQG